MKRRLAYGLGRTGLRHTLLEYRCTERDLHNIRNWQQEVAYRNSENIFAFPRSDRWLAPQADRAIGEQVWQEAEGVGRGLSDQGTIIRSEPRLVLKYPFEMYEYSARDGLVRRELYWRNLQAFSASGPAAAGCHIR